MLPRLPFHNLGAEAWTDERSPGMLFRVGGGGGVRYDAESAQPALAGAERSADDARKSEFDRGPDEQSKPGQPTAAMGSTVPMLSVADAIDSVAHIIQVALTPVFLLSGIGTLLNVFNTRLSRVSDHREHTNELLRDESDEVEKMRLRAHLARLQRRTLALDASVMFSAVGAASACGAAFVLFLVSLGGATVASWLFVLFGLALGCTVCALVAMLIDSVLAWHGLHRDGPLPHTGTGRR